MATTTILLTTFPGLDLPRTLSLPIPTTSTLANLHDLIAHHLPASVNPRNLLLTTTSAARLLPTSTPLSTLTHGPTPGLLPLQLRPRTLGGKGGFGSQLRAAGGRMSSSKKKKQQNVPNSNRNLDGRRMRTIEEAKRLTEYLAVKPEMEKKEKEEKYRRWTEIVENTEKAEREMREGGRAKGDGAWILAKEDAEKSVREAVARGLVDEANVDKKESDESAGGSEGSSSEGGAQVDGEMAAGSTEAVPKASQHDEKGKAKKVWGWDEDDEDDDSMSDEEEA